MPRTVENQKQKEFLKTLSEEATDLITERMYQISEVLNFDLIYLSILDMLVGLNLVANLGIGLTDFTLYHIEFNFRLPTLDELLQGLHIIVEQISLEDVFSEFMDFEFGIEYDPSISLDFPTTIFYFFKNDIFPGISFPNLPIGRYGIDKYGKCIYYTPYLPAPFKPTMPESATDNLISQITKLSISPHIQAQLVALGVHPDLVKGLTRKVDWFEKCMEKGFFLGANLLDYSRFAPKIYYNGQEGAEIEIEPGKKIFVPNIDMVSFGFILGVSQLGLDRFVVTNTTIFRTTGPRFSYYRAMRMKQRFVSPISGLVFRKTWREMQSVHKHRSSLKYGTHRHLIEQIRRQVKGYLANRDLDAFTLNKYVNAVVDLVYRKRLGHKRTKLWKTTLPEDYFRKLWIEKWKTMGLKKEILEELYSRFSYMQEVTTKL